MPDASILCSRCCLSPGEHHAGAQCEVFVPRGDVGAAAMLREAERLGFSAGVNLRRRKRSA